MNEPAIVDRVPGAKQPIINKAPYGYRAYCVYSGRSAATGGTDLDVFISETEERASSSHHIQVSSRRCGHP
jgi:hypothetical protein